MKVVSIPCIVCAVFILFLGAENLAWKTGYYYPSEIAPVRYVNNLNLLTPSAIRDICNLPLTTPELKRIGKTLYLRCGSPGVEGVWKIKVVTGK